MRNSLVLSNVATLVDGWHQSNKKISHAGRDDTDHETGPTCAVVDHRFAHRDQPLASYRQKIRFADQPNLVRSHYTDVLPLQFVDAPDVGH